jgi:hypothetical protein
LTARNDVVVILSRECDAAARSLASSWGQAAVLCCIDLGQHRTAIAYPNITDSTLTVDGRSLPIGRIQGVLNLLPSIAPDELRFYPAEEREYQAAEFYALLQYLLSALSCPVINRPTALSLNGPVFNPLGWYHLASRVGIPLAPLVTSTNHLVPAFDCRDRELIEVEILAGRLLSESGTIADSYLLALARESQVQYLAARFWRKGTADVRFVAANAIPNPQTPGLQTALMQVFHA